MGTSASMLGVHEFSLFARVQSDEIEINRARSGEVLIPETELERLAGGPIETSRIQENTSQMPDRRLGIERRYGGLRRNGESASFRVPGYGGGFTESEINGYRAAVRAIATQLESVKDLKEQLSRSDQSAGTGDSEINTSQTGPWQVRAALLKLDRSEVFLCQRDNEFAVIERFDENTRYAKANGNAEILLQGDDAAQLAADFNGNAQLTVEYMASNLVARAQKIVWEQFPDHRPGHIVAAISERCRQAAAHEEMVHDLGYKPSINRGVRI